MPVTTVCTLHNCQIIERAIREIFFANPDYPIPAPEGFSRFTLFLGESAPKVLSAKQMERQIAQLRAGLRSKHPDDVRLINAIDTYDAALAAASPKQIEFPMNDYARRLFVDARITQSSTEEEIKAVRAKAGCFKPFADESLATAAMPAKIVAHVHAACDGEQAGVVPSKIVRKSKPRKSRYLPVFCVRPMTAFEAHAAALVDFGPNFRADHPAHDGISFLGKSKKIAFLPWDELPPLTYTIAYDRPAGVLLVCQPDGDALKPSLARMERAIGSKINRNDMAVASGLVLTDDKNAGEVVYGGHVLGQLSDVHGKPFEYAVKVLP